MRIGEAADLVGTSVRSLRHFEDEGLIVTGRYANGYRDFCPSTVTVARAARELIDQGLPTRLVRALLPHLTGTVESGPPCPEVLAEIARHHDQLDRRITALTRNRDAIAAFLAAAGTHRP